MYIYTYIVIYSLQPKANILRNKFLKPTTISSISGSSSVGDGSSEIDWSTFDFESVDTLSPSSSSSSVALDTQSSIDQFYDSFNTKGTSSSSSPTAPSPILSRGDSIIAATMNKLALGIDITCVVGHNLL
jgi:hypothetical protein